jgi:hypothetical protein
LTPHSQQPLTHHIIKQFGCKLNTFTNTGEGQASYINVNGKYFSAEGKILFVGYSPSLGHLCLYVLFKNPFIT